MCGFCWYVFVVAKEHSIRRPFVLWFNPGRFETIRNHEAHDWSAGPILRIKQEDLQRCQSQGSANKGSSHGHGTPSSSPAADHLLQYRQLLGAVSAASAREIQHHLSGKGGMFSAYGMSHWDPQNLWHHIVENASWLRGCMQLPGMLSFQHPKDLLIALQ